MTKDFIFWAQALDNMSPDRIDLGDEEVSPADAERRQEAVSRVSSVVKLGVCIFDAGGVRLTVHDCHFVVEVPSVQRDHVGRTAPIVCHGDYGSTVGDALVDSVTSGLEHFARRIGRDLQREHVERVRDAFATLKKNFSMKRLVPLIQIGGGILVLLVLAYWLVSRI